MALLPAEEAILRGRLTSIETAIASGATSVSYPGGGGSVTYRTLAEMRSVRDDIRRQLGIAPPIRRTVATFNGGFR